MKKNDLLTFAFITTLLFNACTNDDEKGIGIPENGETTYATLTIAEGTPPISRAVGNGGTEDGTTDESHIDHIEIYAFKTSDGTPTSKPYYRINGDDISGKKVRFAVEAVTSNFLVAINMNLTNTADNYATMKAKLAGYSLDEDSSTEAPKIGTDVAFPMSGCIENKTIVVNDTENPMTVLIQRLLSKVNTPKFENTVVDLNTEDIEELWNEDLTRNIEFELDGYVVINGLKKSDAFWNWNDDNDEEDEWDNWTHTSKIHQKTTFTGNDLNVAYSGNDWLTNKIVYVNENDPKSTPVNGLDSYKKDHVYALLVKGTLTPGDDTYNPVTRYWRVNFYKDDNYRIYRNAIYNIEINKVISKGYGTAKEAEEDEDNGPDVPGNNQTGILATINIQPWRVFNQSGDM